MVTNCYKWARVEKTAQKPISLQCQLRPDNNPFKSTQKCASVPPSFPGFYYQLLKLKSKFYLKTPFIPDMLVAGVNATLASQTSILRVTTQSPCHEREGEGDPSGREGSRTKEMTCRYFLNGFCREGDNCQYSHGLSKDPETVVCSNFQCTQEDCRRNEDQEPQVDPKFPPPPPSQSFPPLTDPLVDCNIGAAKPLKGNFEAIGASTDDWVYAIEFVPGQPYYGRFVHPCTEGSPKGRRVEENFRGSLTEEEPGEPAVQESPQKESPVYPNEDSRHLCRPRVRNTGDTVRSLRRIRPCLEAHEKDKKLAFAVQQCYLAVLFNCCKELSFGGLFVNTHPAGNVLFPLSKK
uniref:RING-type E3 ubiquitin transferase n=1 Tax=Monodelphis domestica TaxID=13616 RepID=H9H937_MONDO